MSAGVDSSGITEEVVEAAVSGFVSLAFGCVVQHPALIIKAAINIRDSRRIGFPDDRRRRMVIVILWRSARPR